MQNHTFQNINFNNFKLGLVKSCNNLEMQSKQNLAATQGIIIYK